MEKYKTKPVVVEVVEYDGTEKSVLEIMDLNDHGRWIRKLDSELVIPTPEKNMIASEGDYIIKGPDGELRPCKPDIFHKTYEKVEEADNE